MLPVQEGDLDLFLKKQNGEFLDEDTVLLKFVQICLGLQHVHSKVNLLFVHPGSSSHQQQILRVTVTILLR